MNGEYYQKHSIFKSKFTLFILFLLVLVLIGIGSILYNKTTKPPVVTYQSIKWKRFTDDNFSFSYPPYWFDTTVNGSLNEMTYDKYSSLLFGYKVSYSKSDSNIFHAEAGSALAYKTTSFTTEQELLDFLQSSNAPNSAKLTKTSITLDATKTITVYTQTEAPQLNAPIYTIHYLLTSKKNKVVDMAFGITYKYQNQDISDMKKVIISLIQ